MGGGAAFREVPLTADVPVQLADDVWWVGVRLPDDQFQCHAYFIDNGVRRTLLDTRWRLTVE